MEGTEQEAFEMSRLPLISRKIEDRLRKSGVYTVLDFLQRAGPREARSALAADTGVTEDILLQAAHFADIARVGIRLSDLGRLKRARIQTVDDLRVCSDEAILRYRNAALVLGTVVER